MRDGVQYFLLTYFEHSFMRSCTKYYEFGHHMAKTCPESLTLLPLASCARAAAVGTSRTKETTCYNPSTSAAIPTKHPQLLHAYAIGVPLSYVPYLKSLVFLSLHLVLYCGFTYIR